MSSLNLRDGGYYRRRDGAVAGPLRRTMRRDPRSGIAWVVDVPFTGYKADGSSTRGRSQADLIADADPSEAAAVPDLQKTSHSIVSRSIVAIVDGEKIELIVSSEGVLQRGWSKPIAKKSLATLIELLMEQL